MINEAIYDGRLSAGAWAVLIGMAVLLIGGFSWCFYRMAHAKPIIDTDPEQKPDQE